MNDFRDPLVEEIHETRTKLLQRYGGAEGYARHLREVESELADRVVTREPRRPVITRRKVS
jgi:hypothetical protein